jgi:hypothetical protein
MNDSVLVSGVSSSLVSAVVGGLTSRGLVAATSGLERAIVSRIFAYTLGEVEYLNEACLTIWDLKAGNMRFNSLSGFSLRKKA